MKAQASEAKSTIKPFRSSNSPQRFIGGNCAGAPRSRRNHPGREIARRDPVNVDAERRPFSDKYARHVRERAFAVGIGGASAIFWAAIGQPPVSTRFHLAATARNSQHALFRLQQLLQVYHILLHALLHDLPRVVARLRFHLEKFAEIGDRLLNALFCDISAF
jgi:hypothetical protein